MSEDAWEEPASTATSEKPEQTSSFGFGNKSSFGERRGGFGDRSERGGGFGGGRGGFRNREENGESGGRGGFGGGGFGSRSREEGGEGGGRGGFGGERRGGFGGGRGGGFGNRDGEEGGRGGFGGGGFGSRNREEGGDGERRGGFGGGRGGGFGSRDGEEGGRGGFRGGRGGGFGNRNREEGEDGEKKSFGGFGGRSREEGGDGERRGGFGGGRGGGFGGGERREGGGFGAKRDGDAEGGEEVKRERYIPEEVADTEEALFHNFSVGVNFKKQAEIPVNVSGTGHESVVPITGFEQAHLSELIFSNVKKSKYEIPTPVQKYAIPIILAKRDLMACAQTGSGKTAAYVLPIMTNILADGIQSSSLMAVQQPQALILSPTRELANQIYYECRKFSYGSMIRSAILYGGVYTGSQLSRLNDGCNILVATPGRLLDVLEKGKISLEKVKYFVLDEADRMLDMGFEKQVRDILTKGSIQAKGERCTLMFSATFPKEIQQMAQDFLNDYLFLTVGVVGGANTDVEQVVHKVTKFEKRDKVVEILNEIGNDRTMIFIEHKKQADVMAFYLLQKGYPTTSIHGDRLQSQREEALRDFKTGKSKIIVCTSVAARGLDIEKVNHVINYDLPQSIDEYVHRIGRTGRCGNLGMAISFFDPTFEGDRKLGRALIQTLMQANQKVPAWLSEIAEDSVGSSFAGDHCINDMRDKFSKVAVAETAVADDEEWN